MESTPNFFSGLQLVLDTELPPGWCRFTGRDGLEYGGPLADMPKDAIVSSITIASDLWDKIDHMTRVAKLKMLAEDIWPSLAHPRITPWRLERNVFSDFGFTPRYKV